MTSPFPRIPVSTYRLQFNGAFTFHNAKAIVPYLHELGITDIYASPYLKAKPGSHHGYDIVDPSSLNPEVGTEEDYDDLISEMHRHDMGQVADIVPNHMAIGKENSWWMDVLENGPSSLSARYFDVDWRPVKRELRNKVLLPVLGDQYGKVLEKGELTLHVDRGSFCVRYYDLVFPLRPQTYVHVLRQGLQDLEKAFSPEDPHLIELLSIMTAISHLPPYTESHSEKVRERHREKEVIKRRLNALYQNSESVRRFIDDNVAFLNGVPGDARSFDILDDLLSSQAYRLSFWRVAAEEINYRRFFDINELASVRVEEPRLFENLHSLIFRFIAEGKVTGLRVDHPDGLYNPTEYFRNLQTRCYVLTRRAVLQGIQNHIPRGQGVTVEEGELVRQYEAEVQSNPSFKPFYIVGEKILTRSERMPEEWPIFSTTGYVFLNSVNGIFVDTRNAKAFEDQYARFIAGRINFQETVYEKKKLVMQVAMASEINTLGHYLNRISEKHRHTRDFTLNSLTAALVEIIALFPVYRTYVKGADVHERDRQYVETAVSKAKRRNPAVSQSIYDFVRDVLLQRYPEHLTEAERTTWLDFTMRFQQITGPVMAKGVEDAAFYVYNRLVSVNEVGGSPDRFGTSLETFHGQNIERMKFWPDAMIATSTHDTKRSEDVRARINVLSEIPEEWRQRISFWSRLNRKKKASIESQRVPGRNEEYLLYQTLVGTWPIALKDTGEFATFKQRVREYMLKAVREAKIHTSWINPNAMYEDALIYFIDTVISDDANASFVKDFTAFQRRISRCGMLNSLSQVVLKATAPGIPDFYQGTEVWDFSLVDPDNRRPVDYASRMHLLETIRRREQEETLLSLAQDLADRMEDGAIKLYLTYRVLNYRRDNAPLFQHGEYLPLEVIGQRADCACAFGRIAVNKRVIVVAPRFFTKLVPDDETLPLGTGVWGDTFVAVPFADNGVTYRNVFTDEIVRCSEHRGATILLLSEVFSSFPVAALERIFE
jgi:(1->4)-alpha-D-glucan 1-alpha-D-glucosylmutase